MSDLRELLDTLSVSFKEHGQSPHVTEGWIGLLCPWCGGATGKFGLGVHTRSFAVSCWKCGPHSLVDALCEITGRSYREIKALLGQVDGADSPPVALRPAGKYTEPAGVTELLPAHRNYLAKRGFDPDQIAEQWGVRAIGPSGRLAWRLFIPILSTTRGHLMDRRATGRDQSLFDSWTTRAVGAAELRYISAPPDQERVPLKHTLYGAHLAKSAVVVVEGPTDVWRIGPGAVATYGAQFTREQVLVIAKFPLRVIALDQDAAQQARRLANELACFPGTTYLAQLSGKDPDSSPVDEIDSLRGMLA